LHVAGFKDFYLLTNINENTTWRLVSKLSSLIKPTAHTNTKTLKGTFVIELLTFSQTSSLRQI